ncbi:MAG: NAD(P)-dependent oxidoreductase [Candidatus Saccharimonas sp.]|nr:NAD(P)-dependent oxidoreductase [Planctomycetaceae bacterium]
MNVCTEEDLEDRLSEPTEAVMEMLARLPGDILFLGVAGKMGPSMARMARRASDLADAKRRVIGVARFTDGSETQLQSWGVETIRCDLLDEAAVARLPDAPNIVYLAGRKFGSTGDEPLTWAMNCVVPAIVCQRYRSSRIVALSTGNVYGLVPITEDGSCETDPLAPVGEYAQSCLGRERVFQHFSRAHGTPTSLIRLNYACDLRYGVLVDLAHSVWEGRPVDLRMGHFNTIWQGDANALTLTALAQAVSPAWVVNITGPEKLSVREVCEHLGRVMNRPVEFTGVEAPTALLSDCSQSLRSLGSPRVSAATLIDWVAEWTMSGRRLLGKPTHFESRDGKF